MSRAPKSGGEGRPGLRGALKGGCESMIAPGDLFVQDESARELIGDAYEFVSTILPAVSPRSIASNPCRASASGTVLLIAGRTPLSMHIRISRLSSSRVPIVDPITDSCRKKIRVSSAGGASPVVAPEMMIFPPGLSARTEWAHVAW